MKILIMVGILLIFAGVISALSIPSSPAETEEIPVYSGGGDEGVLFVTFLATGLVACALCPSESPYLQGAGFACGVVSLGCLIASTGGEILNSPDFFELIFCILTPP